jgi:hypothetical protein
MLQDTSLLTSLLDPDSLNKVLEQHPALVDAAGALVAMFEDLHGHRPLPQMSPNHAAGSFDRQEDQYSLMNLSDDDDELEGGVDASPPQGQHVMMPNGLAAAAAARANATRSGRAAASSQVGSQRNAEITLDMLRQALGITNASAEAASTSNDTTTTAPSSGSSSDQRSSTVRTAASTAQAIGSHNSVPSNATSAAFGRIAPSRNWTAQLEQMHQLGLNDDAVNVQALEASNGEVQAAIELIFSGVFN